MERDLKPVNPANFHRMAHGDAAGLQQLASEFFDETRSRMTNWNGLMRNRDFDRLAEDLHRCKGGAYLFGLERLVDMIGLCERPHFFEEQDFDLEQFASELSAAENAVIGLVD